MNYIAKTLENLKKNHAEQAPFLQAATEVLKTIEPAINADSKYEKNSILERICVPDRAILFRVTWQDDAGKIQVNNGYRVQFNQAIGPYKGGLRFHPSVNLGVIKFLGFEQIFKNALTTLNMGGGKGGSDFDPKGKSDGEVMRFCQSFMNELYRHVGATVDVPAGDIGVGGREIGYLYGQYKKITNLFEGVLTGKDVNAGGSLGRTPATGYGSVYFAEEMLNHRGESLKGKVCTVSGSGNVAIYTIEKLLQIGAKPVTCSDSRGMIYDPDGIDVELLKDIKENRRESLAEYVMTKKSARYTSVENYKNGENAVFSVPCFAAFPSATQNELNLNDAKNLLKNGCKCVNEGANMPSTLEAIELFLESKICFGPAKAANAGGVAVSGLEMAQNASMQRWSFEDVDSKLHNIMKSIFKNAHNTAEEFKDPTNLVMGANIAGFRRVADAMINQGF